MRFWAGAACAAALLAAPLAAQEETERPNALREGAHSLSFTLPQGGGGMLGVWRMVSPRTNLGVGVGVQAQRSETEHDGGEVEVDRWELALELAARRYVSTARAVAPFLEVGVFGAVARVRAGQEQLEEASSTQGGLGAGAGVEWFPARSVSVGGSTGARLLYRRSRLGPEVEAPAPADGGPTVMHGGEARQTDLVLHTFTSQLAFRIYF